MTSERQSDNQVRFSFPDARVFIFGVEVSHHVESISVHMSDQRTPLFAEILLTNPDDFYTITSEDIYQIYAKDSRIQAYRDQNKSTEGDRLQRYRAQQEKSDPAYVHSLSPNSHDSELDLENSSAIPRPNSSTSYYDAKPPFNVKKEVIKVKVKERQLGEQPLMLTVEEVVEGDDLNYFLPPKALKGDFLRFPIVAGHCIFHTGDPVTIFIRDPLDLNAWYWGFRGTVSDWNTSRSSNNHRQLNIKAEGNLRMLRLARVNTNWALHDLEAVQDTTYDAFYRSWQSDSFKELTLPEYFRLLLFGFADMTKDMEMALNRSIIRLDPELRAPAIRKAEKFYSVNGVSKVDLSLAGAGCFNLKDTTIALLNDKTRASISPKPEYSTQDNGSAKADELSSAGWEFQHINNIAEWYKKVDTRLPSTMADVRTELDILIPTYITLSDTSNDARAVVLNKAISAIEADVDSGTSVEHAFMTYVGENPHIFLPIYGRLMMLLPRSLAPGINRDILNIDFSNGTATQTQFTTRLQMIYNIVERLRLSMYDSPRGDIIVETPLYWVDRDDIEDPDLRQRFSFELKDTIDHSSHFTDERVKTRVLSSYNTIKGLAQGTVADSAGLTPSTVTLDALVPAFGVRVEYAPTFGAIATPLAARYNAFLYLTRVNAEAWRETVQTIYRPGLSPNRSCWFETSDFHATIRSVNFSIRWGKSGSVSQTITLDTRRGWSGMITEVGKDRTLRKVYESFGGRASDPIDYSLLFREIPTGSTMTLDGEYLTGLVTALTDPNDPKANLLEGKPISSIVENGRFTSGYGHRVHPISGETRLHQGIDIAAPSGAPIRAPAGGVVSRISSSPTYGYFIEILHGDGTTTKYAHMASPSTLSEGSVVSIGAQIGQVGSTGTSTGNHLHFEVKDRDGRAVNPFSVMSP